MKRILSALALAGAFLFVPTGLHAQTTTITASNIKDSGSNAFTGSWCAQPTQQFVAGGGGNILPTRVCYTVTAGVLQDGVTLYDTSLTNPVNICYRVTILNQYQEAIASYACMQPSGGTYSFDTFVQSAPPYISAAFTVPIFKTNGATNPSQNVLNIVGSGVTYGAGGTVNIAGGSGGSMTWPSGAAGVPNYNGGSGYGTSYSSTNPFPATFLPQASTSAYGTVEVDGTTCNITGGKLVCPGSGGGGATTPATTNLLKGNGSVNGVSTATPGTDYAVPVTATRAGQGPISSGGGTTYVAGQIAPVGGSYTFYLSGSTYYARNNNTMAVDYSGTDAGVVINAAINNIASVCGHLYFEPGVYNINSLVQETYTGYTTTYYGIGFPGNASSNQFCQWFVEGDSAPDLRDEFGDPAQTNGVVLNITSTALSSISGTPMVDDIWVRPESGGSGVSGSIWVKNIDVRFPTNQRGNESGIDATQSSNANYENVIADTAVAGGSLAFPVSGSIGMYGLTSSNSVHEENYMKNSYVIGYDTSFDIESEHTILINSFGLNTNYCVNYGVRGATINHASTFIGGGCGEAIHGLTIGANVAAHTQLDWTGFDMEDLSSGIWQPVVWHAKETNAGGSYGHITYSRDYQGTQTVISGGLFDGGGGTGFTIQDQNKNTFQTTSVTSAGSGGITANRFVDNEPATTGGAFPADFFVPNLPAGGFAEIRFGQSLANGQMANWGFWNVGAANNCNQEFLGVYGSSYPLTVDYNNNVGIGVPLGTCAAATLEVNGTVQADTAVTTPTVTASTALVVTGGGTPTASSTQLRFSSGFGEAVAYGANNSTVPDFYLASASLNNSLSDLFLHCIYNTSCAFTDTVIASKSVSAQSYAGSGTATFAAGAAAGTSPGTPTCLSGTVCDSFSGHLTLVTGTSPTTGALLQITFPVTRANFPSCFAKVNLVASPYTEISSTYSTSATVLNFYVGTAPAASTEYELTYVCGGK